MTTGAEGFVGLGHAIYRLHKIVNVTTTVVVVVVVIVIAVVFVVAVVDSLFRPLELGAFSSLLHSR